MINFEMDKKYTKLIFQGRKSNKNVTTKLIMQTAQEHIIKNHPKSRQETRNKTNQINQTQANEAIHKMIHSNYKPNSLVFHVISQQQQ